MTTVECAALLVDLDGTLVDSGDSVTRAWTRFALEVGRSPEEILAMCHGVRTTEVIEALDLDEPVMPAALRVESWIVDDGAPPTPGAVELLAALPPTAWAVVTSSLGPTARSRFDTTELTPPQFVVTAEDVAVGKPDPACYLMAAERLGVAPADCVVLEDAPAGIGAGKAAGMTVIAVTTTHVPAELSAADFVVRDLRSLAITSASPLTIRLRDLQPAD